MNIKYILVLLLLISECSFSENSPKDIVEKYCELDFSGARLNSEEFEKYREIVSYEEEPGWDTVIGIKGYKVLAEKVDGNNATVKVSYEIEKSWPASLENLFEYSRSNFHLSLVNGRWRIDKYIEYPRVSGVLLCEKFELCAK